MSEKFLDISSTILLLVKVEQIVSKLFWQYFHANSTFKLVVCLNDKSVMDCFIQTQHNVMYSIKLMVGYNVAFFSS